MLKSMAKMKNTWTKDILFKLIHLIDHKSELSELLQHKVSSYKKSLRQLNTSTSTSIYAEEEVSRVSHHHLVITALYLHIYHSQVIL